MMKVKNDSFDFSATERVREGEGDVDGSEEMLHGRLCFFTLMLKFDNIEFVEKPYRSVYQSVIRHLFQLVSVPKLSY